MPVPGRRNLITDVDGLRLGNAADPLVLTGVTVLLPDAPAVAGVDVRGGAPGTRETDALSASCLVDRVHAVVLSGGSAFGLDAAGEVAAVLGARGIGFAVGTARVPIVPAAILFDLLNGGDKGWGETPPYRALGRAALDAVGHDFALGNEGAGCGAKAGPLKGGLGSASAIDEDGLQVGAVVAVNAWGRVTMGERGQFWAWPFEIGAEFGGLPPPAARPAPDAMPGPGAPLPGAALPGANTTIAVVATDAILDKGEAQRVAIMAHDGLARAIRPVHTPFDGDTVFALATGRRALGGPRPESVARIGALAADCLARAVARGVHAAASAGNFRSWADTYGDRQ